LRYCLFMALSQVTSMAPPPSVTFIVFHPQDSNIIAFGMEDSTIQIYNIHVGQVCVIPLYPHWM
jgi:WD40 repeat protein